MKKFLLLAYLGCSTAAFSQTTINYPGNGKNSFGGAVGQGSVMIEEQADSLNLTFTRGPGTFDSIIVFYIDFPGSINLPGAAPISSTAGLSGSSTDSYQAAVAGHNPATGRAVLNFPTDFQPDGAIVFDKTGGKVFLFGSGLFFPGGSISVSTFTVDPSGTNSAATYTQRNSKAALGVSGQINFNFVATYIGKSASRSNESFGDPFTDYEGASGPSSYNPYTITSYFTFMAGALPVKLIDFTAAAEGNTVNISWMVADETNIEKYEVQRSTDGISFSTIALFKARNSTISLSYSAKDLSAQNGFNYYRLLITERGKTEISRVVSLNVKGLKNKFAVNCPEPKTLNIILNGVDAGSYKLSVLSNNGQLLQEKILKINGGNQNIQIQLNQNLIKGIYRVALRSASAKYITNIFVQ